MRSNGTFLQKSSLRFPYSLITNLLLKLVGGDFCTLHPNKPWNSRLLRSRNKQYKGNSSYLNSSFVCAWKIWFCWGLNGKDVIRLSIQPITQIHLKRSSRKANNSKGTILFSQEELLCIRPTSDPHQFTANEAESQPFKSVTSRIFPSFATSLKRKWVFKFLKLVFLWMTYKAGQEEFKRSLCEIKIRNYYISLLVGEIRKNIRKVYLSHIQCPNT